MPMNCPRWPSPEGPFTVTGNALCLWLVRSSASALRETLMSTHTTSEHDTCIHVCCVREREREED